MMSKVGNPQIYEDNEQRYVSPTIFLPKHPHPPSGTARQSTQKTTICPRNTPLINGTSISNSCASNLLPCE